MEYVLKIIYDNSMNNKIISLKDIDKIMSFIVNCKDLNNFVLDSDVQSIRSKNLASYSVYTKKISIYSNTIEIMLKNIEKNIQNLSDNQRYFYENLTLLQVLLHEIEHANQEKIAYTENSFEAFLIRMTKLITLDNNIDIYYDCCPTERLAEIKSYNEIISFSNDLNIFDASLIKLLNSEKILRQLKGYHYNNKLINVPIIDYFNYGGKTDIIKLVDINNTNYNLEERFKFGFPITKLEYGESLKEMVLTFNNNFKNRIKL